MEANLLSAYSYIYENHSQIKLLLVRFDFYCIVCIYGQYVKIFQNKNPKSG